MLKLTKLTKTRGAKSHLSPPYILGAYSVDYLVVGGGGGGGGVGGGGGGAGGFRDGTSTVTMFQSVLCTVGTRGNPVSNGAASEAFGISSAGGGGAAIYSERAALNGGCGGGGHMQHNAHTISRANGVGNTPSVSPSQGGDGGYGQNFVAVYVGGGGGGGGPTTGGQGNSGSGQGGNGGAGREWPTGSGVYYAGGGAGGCHNSGSPGTGGVGGGANAAPALTAPTAAQDGTANTGGGGGGSGSGGYQDGGYGGSGVVIIRYIGYDNRGVGGNYSVFRGYSTHTFTGTTTYTG